MKLTKMCFRKKRYKTFAAAEKMRDHRAKMNAQEHRAGQKLHVYHCPVCNKWHLIKKKRKAA
jgi:lipopolysaccharide biosynthesis regulator YciM